MESTETAAEEGTGTAAVDNGGGTGGPSVDDGGGMDGGVDDDGGIE